MIKFLASTLLFTFLSAAAFSQRAHTIYITGDGVKTTDPNVADSYLMFQEVPNDSLWFVRQFAMNNMIMTSGYYRDEQMTIPHGKFDYYKFVRAYKAFRFDFAKRKYDTIEHADTNFRVLSGNYVYGKRQGNWEHYNEHGKLISTCHFQNDIMEGLYREYNPEKGIITFQGIMANNEKVGNWNYFSPNGDILGTEIYKNGRLVKIKSHLNDKQFKIKNGMPDYDVPGYLNQVLSQKKFNDPGRRSAVYYFRLKKDGHLSEPNMLRESKLELDVAIIDALLNAPVWESATHEKEPVEAHVTISLLFNVDDDKKIHVYFYSNNSDEQINLYPVL